jgi:hypothetical protein
MTSLFYMECTLCITPIRTVGFRLGMGIHRGMISPLNRDLRIP